MKKNGIKISYAKAERAFNSLVALEQGFERTVDGKQIKSTFKFGGATHWALAELMVEIEDALRPYQRARNRKINELSNGTGRIDAEKNPELISQLNAFVDEHDGTEIEIKARAIQRSELKCGEGVDENPIPRLVLAGLIPVLTD